MESRAVLDSAEGWIDETVWGQATVEGYIQVFERGLRAAIEHQVRFTLANHLGITGAEKLTTQDLLELSDWFRAKQGTAPNHTTAVVVPSQLHFGLTRMFDAFTASRGVAYHQRIFSDLEQARAWLREQKKVAVAPADAATAVKPK